MLKEINLEISLKPFKKTEPEYIRGVVKQIFGQWKYLLQGRESISFLLWAADGSEILDYKGDLDEVIEWAYLAGTANRRPTLKAGEDKDVNLHDVNVLYTDEIPVVSYRTIKTIIEIFREECASFYPDSKFSMGIPFDIGPEFAKSDFKYRRHREICTGGEGENAGSFINSYSTLAADDYPYAGFPSGIPEGTPFGKFLGRQSLHFMKDLGFDYIWLSNGMGFSAKSWSSDGEIFDGEKFHPEKVAEVTDQVFSFWKYFREENPDCPIYTRGTNFSAGIDYAVDAVGLHRLYNSDLGIVPPPNSPWAAINANYGLELMGHLTRNCELPGDKFMFRYYLHDPWWCNTPWYDRYGGSAHDIYLPMSLSRIDEEGRVKAAEIFNILSIDNTLGNMPDRCVYETIPHFLTAEKNAPDAPAPFVWVYPFREYTTATDERSLRTILSGDLFVCRAMIAGFPMSGIVSCDNFLKTNKSIYERSVLVTPVPIADSKFEEEILEYIADGGRVLFYGSVDAASKRFLDAFSLKLDDGMTGELTVDENLSPDSYRSGTKAKKIVFREDSCNGKLNTRYASDRASGIAVSGYALSAEYKNAVWYRAPVALQSLNYDTWSERGIDDPCEVIWGESVLRTVLSRFGYKISFSKKSPDRKNQILMLHRSNNAEYLSVHSPDMTTDVKMKFPLGAPIFMNRDVELDEDGVGTYHFGKYAHEECRVFVEQSGGVILAKEMAPVSMKYRRRIAVSGLKNATVRFFGEKYCEELVKCYLDAPGDLYKSDKPFDCELIKSKEYGTYVEVRGVTGEMLFSMPFPSEIQKN